MKTSKRAIAAVIVVIFLALTAVGVWAAPNRVGTVPVLPEEVSGMLSESINFGTGTITVQASTSDGGSLTVQKVADPVNAVGALPEGWVTLLDEALEITVIEGSMSTAQICVPYSPDMENKTPTFHFWDTVNKIWTSIPTEVTTGTPPLVCGTGSSEGKYVLLGK
jgi:hypothetical protein